MVRNNSLINSYIKLTEFKPNIAQSDPINPIAQLQENESSALLQVPLFRQGFGYSLFILALGVGAWAVTFIVGTIRRDAT